MITTLGTAGGCQCIASVVAAYSRQHSTCLGTRGQAAAACISSTAIACRKQYYCGSTSSSSVKGPQCLWSRAQHCPVCLQVANIAVAVKDKSQK